MTSHGPMDRHSEVSPRFWARLAGVFYFINIATSLIAFSGKGGHSLIVASGIAAMVSYIAVTAVLYYIFRPVSPRLSSLAALFSLAGIANGVLSPLHLFPFRVHSLVFFGIYCLLIAYLIVRSTFMPLFLGVLMALAGLGWLTFVSRSLAAYLSPYHYIMGGIGEGALTVWLLAVGVEAGRWKQQAANQQLAGRTEVAGAFTALSSTRNEDASASSYRGSRTTN